jgi:hypothetical protein
MISSQKRVRFAISTAAAVIFLGASLATSVFAQTLPAQTVRYSRPSFSHARWQTTPAPAHRT